MKFGTASLSALAALATSTAASAAVESFTATLAPTPIPFSQTLQIASFDTGLGSLTGISLNLVDNSTAEVDVLNTSNSPEQFTNATASVPFIISGPAGLTVGITVNAGPFSGSLPAGFGVTAFPGVIDTISTIFAVPVADYAAFESAGSTPLPITVGSGVGTYGGSGDRFVGFGGKANLGGSVTISYTYDTGVPEPASWALMLVGVGALGGALRGRRQVSASIG